MLSQKGNSKTASGWNSNTDIIAQFGTSSGHRWIGVGETIIAAKLELGDKQTLAHKDSNGTWVLNELPPYTLELCRCKRFLSVCRGIDYFHRADAVTANNLQFFVVCSITSLIVQFFISAILSAIFKQ